jgi:starch-binding outer membrane protein, SusD/RagB family
MNKYLLIAIALVAFTSCKKWLDVQPVSQVPESELFKTAEGFEEALNGIYTKCTDQTLYGYELTCGTPEALAQNYTYSGDDWMRFQQTANYNYKDLYFIPRRDAIWNGLYNAITNCNLLLDNIEKNGSILAANERTLIKAEALGLRAYLHMDVLRLFAPSYKSNPASLNIPYVTTFSKNATPWVSVTDVLTKAAADLEQAKQLIKPVDPIVMAGYVAGYPGDQGYMEENSNSLFLQNRRHRLNYYAICGELARVYLYLEKKSDAITNATEVMQSAKFPWTNEADFINADPKLKDRIMYKELVFAWYNPAMKDTLANRFNGGLKSLFIEQNAGNALYESSGAGGTDRRYKEWFKGVSGASSFNWYQPLKYQRDADQNRHYLVAPAIRLSEMYYIAAECTYDTDPTTALTLLQTVRINRGIGAALTVANKEQFLTELVKEARKEFYAEGQIFYMYKRLNRAITGQLGVNIPASDNVFVLPVPDSEIELGNHH